MNGSCLFCLSPISAESYDGGSLGFTQTTLEARTQC